MKKQLRSKNVNSTVKGKPENYTKASSKKSNRNKLIKKKSQNRQKKPALNLEASQT